MKAFWLIFSDGLKPPTRKHPGCFFSRWCFLASYLFLIKDSACFEWIFSALLDIGHHLSLLMLIGCLTNPSWHTFLTEIAYHRKAFFCKGTPVNFITSSEKSLLLFSPVIFRVLCEIYGTRGVVSCFWSNLEVYLEGHPRTDVSG